MGTFGLFNIDDYFALFGGDDAGIYSNRYKRLLDIEKIKYVNKLVTIDTNTSSSSPDVIFGGDNTNKIIGTNSSDFIDPLSGKHLIDGKSGSDKLLIFDSSNNFNIITINGISDIRPRDSSEHYQSTLFRTKSIEKVVFSNKEVTLDTANKNYIFGTFGSETITGTSNDDVIDPMGGSDTIRGGFGEDQVLIFLPSTEFSAVTISGAKATFTGKSTAEEYAGRTINLDNIVSK